jgi:glucokinase
MGEASNGGMILAGDIGGTKTNLALYEKGTSRPEEVLLESFPSENSACLEDILEEFMKERKTDISAACFGIAGPVTKGRVKTTNLPWEISEEAISERFKWEKVSLINDLTATALAIPLLRSDELEEINPGTPMEEEPIGLLAPGTGLGISLVVRKGGQFTPLASEGGHADFAPLNRRQYNLFEFFSQMYGHVSIERIVSGPGIFDIYRWLRSEDPAREAHRVSEALKEEDPPKVITDAAINHGDPLSVEALEMFVSIFGACAGNLALTGFTRGGVFLGGGITPKVLPAIKNGPFVESYCAKGRFEEALKAIPVWAVLNDHAALLGAANYALGTLGESGRS